MAQGVAPAIGNITYSNGTGGYIFSPSDWPMLTATTTSDWKNQKLAYDAAAEMYNIKREAKNKKNMDSSNKYYRVLQDTPAWKKGALLTSNCGKYCSVGELFNQEYTPSDYYEFSGIVEKGTEYFGRVYQVKVDGKTKYLPKEEAKKVIEAEIQY